MLLSAVLPSNYAEDLKLTYQDWIVTCTMITVTEKDCVLNLHMGNKYNLVAENATGITVQYEFRTLMIETFICDARCGKYSSLLDRVEIKVNEAAFLGLLLSAAASPFLIYCGVTVWKKQRKKRRNDLNRAARSYDQFHRNTPTVDSLWGPRHEVRTSYRREELPPTVPREELSLAPFHAPPTASRGKLNLEHVPHIAPGETLPSYEQALEMILATDIPESRC